MEEISKNKKIMIFTFITIGILIAGILIFLSKPRGEVSINIEEQLSLGEKYLSELDYENAIIAFNKVINIDPKNVRAYIGLSDAYMGKGDIEKAIEILETGIDTIPGISDELEKKLQLLKQNIIYTLDGTNMAPIYFDKCEEIIELFKSEEYEKIPEYLRNEVALPIRDLIQNNSEEKSIYYGNIEDGLGICVYNKELKESTEAYVGEFDNGVRSGTGLAIFTNNGSQGYYIGEWNEDNVHGSGAMYVDSFYSKTGEFTSPDGIYDYYNKGVTINGNAEGYWLEGFYDDGKIPTEDGDETNGTIIAGYQYYCINGHPTSMGKVNSNAWWVDPVNDEENIIGSNLMAKAYIVYDNGTEVFEEAPHEHAGRTNCKICREFYENYESGNGQYNLFHPWVEEDDPDYSMWFGFYVE